MLKYFDLVVANNSNTSTDENENQAFEAIENEAPLKGRRGKSAPKANDLIGILLTLSS